MAASETGNYDLVDSRTGELLVAGPRTDSGQVVTPEYALGYHAWWRATTLIANKSASVPRLVMRRKKDEDGAEDDQKHPVRKLIAIRANEEQTAFQFWLQMTGHLTTRGNAYAFLWRNTLTNQV
jgi:phage portal protein BeeE